MNNWLIAICIVVIIVIYYYTYQRFSKFNTSPVPFCEADKTCTFYNVHNLHKNKKEAAALMHTIVEDVDKLMEHLENKYKRSKYSGGINPDKENRIDIIPSVEYASDIYGTDYMQERIDQLFERYNPDVIYEISPRNKSNLTSYTENKGEQLVLCLREKKPEANGEYSLHDKNTIMFVVMHELTHIMNDEWGHQEDFWKLFKIMLENAVECGIYTPVDYSKRPINYCGLDLNHNPLFH